MLDNIRKELAIKSVCLPHMCIQDLFNSLPAYSVFGHLMIIIANSLDPDQARQNVWLDLVSNCLTL